MDARLDPPSMQASRRATPTSSARRRPSQRRRHRSLVISTTARTANSRHSPHRLRYGIFHQRCHAQSAASSLETATLTPQGFKDVGKGQAPAPVNTSSGSPSATRNKLSSTTSPHPQSPSRPKSIPSTASSTMCAPEKLLEVEGAKTSARRLRTCQSSRGAFARMDHTTLQLRRTRRRGCYC